MAAPGHRDDVALNLVEPDRHVTVEKVRSVRIRSRIAHEQPHLVLANGGEDPIESVGCGEVDGCRDAINAAFGPDL